jgi:Sec-independent protein translocase protein TatA
MGLGTEILFLLMLGLVFLGPKQMHSLLRRVAKAKAQFDHATRTLKAQMAAELEQPPNPEGEFKS